MSQPALSVVIPVSARAEELSRILAHVREGLGDAASTAEFLIVVDGGQDRALDDARRLAADDPSLRVLHFARAFGEGACLEAGLRDARGPVILTHPAYFQVQAPVLGQLLDAVADGADLAFASRLPRSDSLFNRFQRWCFNSLVRGLLGLRYRDLACGVRALRKETLELVAVHGAYHRFITLAAVMSGCVVKEVDGPLHDGARRSRAYGPLTYLKRVLDVLNVYFLTRFRYKPLRFFGIVGSVLFVPGMLICLWLTIEKLFFAAHLGDRPMFLFGVLLTVLGFQVIALGLVGEILSFSIAQRTKSYRIREIVRKRAPEEAAGGGVTTEAQRH